MNTTSLGQAAEAAVAEDLSKSGYKILERNWRRPNCEIDIVASKDKAVYFVEVKYRTSAGQGAGFDYITNKKQRQMEFAASSWVAENGWSGDYRLMAAEVSTDDSLSPIVGRIVEL